MKIKLKKNEIRSITLQSPPTVVPSGKCLGSISVPLYLSAASMIPYSNKANTIGICMPMYQSSM